MTDILNSLFKHVPCYPLHCGCELITPGFPAEPINTLTNIFLFIFAIYLILKFYKMQQDYFILGICCLVGSLSSFYLHATYFEIANCFDFSAVVLTMGWPYIKLIRRGDFRKKFSYLFLFYLFTFFLIVLAQKLRYLPVLILFLLSLPLIMRELKEIYSPNLKYSLLSSLIGIVFFIGDRLQLICWKSLPIPPHSIWHFFSTAGIVFYYLHFYLKDRLGSKPL